MQASRALGRFATKNVGRRNAHHQSTVQSTYNDLPQPQGNWKTHHDARSRKYNAHFVLGVGTFIATIVGGRAAGLLETYNVIPDKPAVIESYK